MFKGDHGNLLYSTSAIHIEYSQEIVNVVEDTYTELKALLCQVKRLWYQTKALFCSFLTMPMSW